MKHKIAVFLNKIASYLNKDIPGAVTSKTPSNRYIKVDYFTDCTYEAAFYLTQGAKIEKIEISKVAENRIDKLGYKNQWKIFLSDIPKRSINVWKNGLAQSLVLDIKRERQRIKKYIKNYKDNYDTHS